MGYVLDEEPVDAIMKKFEELERFERELEASKAATAGKDATPDEPEMTDRQLEELFRRTSNFTVDGAFNGLDGELVLDMDFPGTGFRNGEATFEDVSEDWNSSDE